MSKELGAGGGNSRPWSRSYSGGEKDSLAPNLPLSSDTLLEPSASVKCCRGFILLLFIKLSIMVTHGGCHKAVKAHNGDGLTYHSRRLTSSPWLTDSQVSLLKGREESPIQETEMLPHCEPHGWSQPLLDTALLGLCHPILHWWFPKCPDPH